jgi:hypothetical protein
MAIAVMFLTGSAIAADQKDEPPKPAPKDAIVLFDGNNVKLEDWQSMRGGKAAEWKVENGHMECVPGKGDIMTKKVFGPDFQLHVEFWIPLMPNARGQARGNSGVYLQGRYEIQVLDSYMNETYPKGVCGALYGIIAPSKNASKPPEQWQTYDITFKGPRVDEKGKVTKPGELTVVHNGVTIIDKGQFDNVTGGALDNKIGQPGPLRLQDHGNKVRFRNIWIKPLGG